MPRDSLRLQAEGALAAPVWRTILGNDWSVQAADNTNDASRDRPATSTTYPGVAAVPDPHLREMRRYRTLLMVDEVHHQPALVDSSADAVCCARIQDLLHFP